MNYEIIDDKTAVLFIDNTANITAIAKKIAEESNLDCVETTKDYVPNLWFKDKVGNTVSHFLLIRNADEEQLQEQPNIILDDVSEEPPIEKAPSEEALPQEFNRELLSQYQSGVKYTKKALTDIIQEFNNEIILRELLINTFEEGRSTLDLGGGVIKPMVPKELRGKTQKSFSPYDKSFKKHLKNFMKGEGEPEPGSEEEALLNESMESIDKFFSKMQRGLSKKDSGGIGIQSEEEAGSVKQDISIFEEGKETLGRLKTILTQYDLASAKKIFGEKGKDYQEFLNTLFSLANITYMLFAEQKYEYRDDMATYLQVTSDKAEQFINEYRSLIAYFESMLQNA